MNKFLTFCFRIKEYWMWISAGKIYDDGLWIFPKTFVVKIHIFMQDLPTRKLFILSVSFQNVLWLIQFVPVTQNIKWHLQGALQWTSTDRRKCCLFFRWAKIPLTWRIMTRLMGQLYRRPRQPTKKTAKIRSTTFGWRVMWSSSSLESLATFWFV